MALEVSDAEALDAYSRAVTAVAERPHERRDRPPRLLPEEAGDRPVFERGYRSTTGLTSTAPRSAAGIRAANSSASSRLAQSMR